MQQSDTWFNQFKKTDRITGEITQKSDAFRYSSAAIKARAQSYQKKSKDNHVQKMDMLGILPQIFLLYWEDFLSNL